VPTVRHTAVFLILAATALFARPAGGEAAGPGPAVGLRIDPPEVRLGLFYGGTDVRVEAAVPAGLDVAVLCVGREDRIEMKKKGKVWGILWMNVGEVAFDKVPSLYVLNTSRKLADLAALPVLEELGVGYPALEAQALGPGGAPEDHQLFRELLLLKESEGLFSVDQGGIGVEPEVSGSAHVSSKCFLPAKTPMGEIEVRVYGFSGGRGRLLDSGRLRISPGGVNMFITSLAGRHGLLYGILAVVIAIVVGLGTGLVFGLGSKKGH
jgi:uncharacterized protein (TIGR02186 family)